MPLIRKTSETASLPSAVSPAVLRSGTADERWSAARSLTTPADVAALSDALEGEQDPRVREAILTSLARIGAPECAWAIIPHIRSESAGVRTAALDSLRAMPEAIGASLPGLLNDPDADVRLLACELVRALPDPASERLLSDLIERDLMANVCAAAIEVLAEVGGQEALPSLERCAARFADEPFIVFAIRVAAERIRNQSADAIA